MQNPQVQVHPIYDESFSFHVLSGEYTDVLRELLGEAWSTERDDIWMHAFHAANDLTADQGFKIHVSSSPRHALGVLRVVVPVCVERGINFKIVGDPALHNLLISKRYPRGASGKFMTIYPPNLEAFKDLIECLHQQTKGEDLAGPRILSDRQYSDSRILFYRYGGFRSTPQLDVDGTQNLCITSPDGEHLRDDRTPYFQLPWWVEDPFGDAPMVDRAPDVLLGGRYIIEGALSFSNTGGIYFGKDTATGSSIVAKEARPLTNCWLEGEQQWDAVYLLRREYAILHDLGDLDFVPDPVQLLDEGDHTFLVEERIHGITFRQFWASNERILAPYLHRPTRMESWVRTFKQLAAELVRMLSLIHRRGVLLGDLSPGNILIDQETLAMWLVDFESAVTTADDPSILRYATLWGTQGYVAPDRASRERLFPHDDLYALGMVFYSAILPINSLFTLKPDAALEFLDRFVEFGLPTDVRDIICSLIDGDAEKANALVADWTS